MTQEDFDLLNQKYKVITYNPESKKLYTNAIRDYFVQGENKTSAVLIVGPPKIKAISLLELRMVIRVSSREFETTVEKTLETQQLDDENIGMLWEVGKEETAIPGNLSVSLIGYGGSEEVIKITSDGIVVKADDLEEQAPPESTWNQILSQVQSFATQAAQSKNVAKESEQIATEKAAEATASAATAAQKATEAISAASTAAEEAATLAAAETEEKIRGFADDRYARALKATAPKAESLTIYPDDGSNIAITSYGYTEQSGSGDPSPTNVRPITVGGIELVELIFNGTENWTQNESEPHIGYLELTLNFEGTETHYAISNVAPPKYSYWDNGVFVDGWHIYFGANFGKNYTVESWKALLAKRYAKGNPIKAWCAPADKTKATGLYTPIIAQGNRWHCECMTITKRLCVGDKVISKADSGCDKAITYDGSVDENWIINSNSSQSSSGSLRFYIKAPFSAQNTESNKLSVAYSNRLYQRTPEETYGSLFDGSFSVQGDSVHVRLEGISTVEELREQLAQKPVTIFVKSQEYTKENDISVAFEVHEKWLHSFSSADNFAISSTIVSDKNRFKAVLYPEPQKTPVSSVAEITSNQYKSVASDGTRGGTYSATGYGISIDSAGSIFIYDSNHNTTKEDFDIYIDSKKADRNEVLAVYPLENTVIYAHDPISIAASPKEDNSVILSGEKTVSATYNKSLKKAIEELQAAMLALGSNLSM